ncbi:MAG: hypothetical protein ACE5HH_03455 [Candidatus Hydrothermarchaeales archaeon]
MAKKLNSWEFLDRHWQETEAVLSLFKDKQELRYAEIRRRLFLDSRSRRERNFQEEKKNGPTELMIKHETQLMRILKALCSASVVKKITKANKVYYRLALPKPDVEEIILRSRIARDASFLDEIMENKKSLEKQLESSKNRIYELNLEIGKLVRENIELKAKLDELQST